jgi:RnfABCDGE-type electron transport complex B subunit
LVERLHAALPQTQCTRCGYPDCRAYAQAVAEGQAQINQCPPGGSEGIARLAALTGRPVLPLNPEHGQESVRQVRGTAPAQVPNVKISVAHGVGGMFSASGTVVLSNQRP